MLKTRKYICTALAALTFITGSAATSFATGNDIFPSVMISLDANAQDIAVNQEHYATKSGAAIMNGTDHGNRIIGIAAVGFTFKVDTIRISGQTTWYHSNNLTTVNGKTISGWILYSNCLDSNRGKSHKVKRKTTVKVTKDGTRIRREACSGSDALGHVKLNTNFTSDYQVKWDNGEIWYHFEKIKNKKDKWVYDCYVFAPLCTVVK